MALYTTLMILLLAFFIVLTVCADSTEGGLHKGIGTVKDAFGMSGGLGLGQFQMFKDSKKSIPVPDELNVEEGVTGIDKDQLAGDGGSGQSDDKVEKMPVAEYFSIPVPFKFDEGKATLPYSMQTYLERVGTAFAFLKVSFQIKCVAEGDAKLASQRAWTVARMLHEKYGVSYRKMSAAGYSSFMNFPETISEGVVKPVETQGLYFYVFMKVQY